MDDEELIAAFRRGDKRAGNRLAERYYRELRSFFHGRVPHDEVEELTQHTLLHTVARIERFAGRSSFRFYVFAVARRVVADRYRKLRRSLDIDEDSPSGVIDSTTSPSDRMTRDERLRVVAWAIGELGTPFRMVLQLHLLGHSNPEIAELLRLNYNTVRSRLSRGMASLRELLDAALDNLNEA